MGLVCDIEGLFSLVSDLVLVSSSTASYPLYIHIYKSLK
jgi:hypothetical protein